MIGAEPPAFHQREDSMNPGQHAMAGHLADRPRVVSVIGEPRIRSVPVGDGSVEARTLDDLLTELQGLIGLYRCCSSQFSWVSSATTNSIPCRPRAFSPSRK